MAVTGVDGLGKDARAADAYGRETAERIYGPDLVQRALRLASHRSLMALGHLYGGTR
ncbi:hypothetical protein [Streptomyces triculaminicus]|uniref:hypothetical protein n=1 Tax=Streptomyces triculaminicus TaxID=2816232 RepID=UPI0037967617